MRCLCCYKEGNSVANGKIGEVAVQLAVILREEFGFARGDHREWVNVYHVKGGKWRDVKL